MNTVFDNYYNEIDPVKRKALLEELLSESDAECLTPDERAFAEEAAKLFALRYEPGNRYAMPGSVPLSAQEKEPYVDRYLYQMMNLCYLSRGAVVFRRSLKKKVRNALYEMGLPVGKDRSFGSRDGSSFASTGIAWSREAIRLEICNAVRRYLWTCGDPDYAKKLFGMVKASDEEKAAHARQDLHDMSEGIRKRLGDIDDTALKEALELYCSAFKEEIKE